jgi:hypothetical protein
LLVAVACCLLLVAGCWVAVPVPCSDSEKLTAKKRQDPTKTVSLWFTQSTINTVIQAIKPTPLT